MVNFHSYVQLSEGYHEYHCVRCTDDAHFVSVAHKIPHLTSQSVEHVRVVAALYLAFARLSPLYI